jgi:hypothetical protein
MASRGPSSGNVPDSVREAVERTIQATLASAQQTRGRAEAAVDDIVRGAEASAKEVRGRVRGAIEERRPASSDEIRDLQRELRAFGRRLDAIEKRLAESGRKAGGGTSAAAKRGRGAGQSRGGKRGAAAKGASRSSAKGSSGSSAKGSSRSSAKR